MSRPEPDDLTDEHCGARHSEYPVYPCELRCRVFNLCHSNYRRGFHMTFANGWTVSVQWGPINYCYNHGFSKPEDSSPTAETACWVQDADGVHRGLLSEVVGHRDANEVVAYIMEVSQRPGVTVCQDCGDKLTGHEDESGTHCRWCTTCVDYRTDEERAADLE